MRQSQPVFDEDYSAWLLNVASCVRYQSFVCWPQHCVVQLSYNYCSFLLLFNLRIFGDYPGLCAYGTETNGTETNRSHILGSPSTE